MGSIEYGCQRLGTPLLLILGHEKCGAVTTACTSNQTDFAQGCVSSIIQQIQPVIEKAKKMYPDDYISHAITENTLLQMENSLKSEIVSSLILENRLTVIPAIYSFTTGKVTKIETNSKPIEKNS
eukprot:TRINITY_DN2772_c0_g1_i21.p2 TRINITY_DN2772_c0_g1~~TRINITY_DN2772_c0_g1_i21.p2  ORF type:complete len:125 (+),score=23.07 TRINITY_DN2772_c0_g1_i21:656-1030(+)